MGSGVRTAAGGSHVGKECQLLTCRPCFPICERQSRVSASAGFSELVGVGRGWRKERKQPWLSQRMDLVLRWAATPSLLAVYQPRLVNRGESDPPCLFPHRPSGLDNDTDLTGFQEGLA